MITALELLIESRALIAEPQNWTQNAYARSMEGLPVPPESPNACKFCSLGAIHHVFKKHVDEFDRLLDNATVDYDARQALRSVMGSVSHFNDSAGHKNVLKAWDRAITYLKEKPTT